MIIFSISLDEGKLDDRAKMSVAAKMSLFRVHLLFYVHFNHITRGLKIIIFE